jgi:putative aldouronate transport system permease protein
MKRSRGEVVFDGMNTVLMVMLMLFTVYPLLYVLFASLSDPRELLKFQGLILWPLGKPTLQGYEMVFRNPNILSGYRNTLFYVTVGTSLNLLLTAFAAFVLTRKDFAIKKIMMIGIVVTMFFDGGLVPKFFVVRGLGMYNTVWALIFPVALNTYNMIIMRTFFQNIPDSLEEAATMEGANDFQLFAKIIIPLSKPVIAVMVLYYGVFHWNSWFNASIFLRDRNLYPLQLILREILIANETDNMLDSAQEMFEESLYRELIKYCTIVVATLPILSIYPFLQKYFVKGVMIGALKG